MSLPESATAMSADQATDDAVTPTAGGSAPGALVAAVLDGVIGAVVAFTHDGRLAAANAMARQLFAVDERAPLGSQRESIVLLPLAEWITPMQSELRGGETRVARTIWYAPRSQWLDLQVVQVGKALTVVTAVDATDREVRHERLSRTERELSSILALMSSSARVIDLSGRIVRANASATANADAVLAAPETLRELWARDQPRRLEDDAPLEFLGTAGMRALAGMTVRNELTAVYRSGQDEARVLEVSASPILDDLGRISGAILLDRDVTDSRRLERNLDEEVLRSAELESRVLTEAERIEQIVEERARALAAQEEAMSRDRRLSAIGRLAAGVMHDVNNALNPIMAAAYLLRHHAESPDAVRDYADRIRKAAETGAATASRVGRFIRQEPMHSGADEVFDLSVLTEEVLQLTEPMPQRRATNGTAVHVERHYGLGVLARGIPGEIREALLNLVSNAMDAMPTGGTLTVSTEVSDSDARVIVRDNGVGMTDEVRERAFEPFFTTKGAGGSGLGLAEVYGIARRHRGSVTIESVPGQGTAVTLSFPLDTSAPVVAVTEVSPVTTVPLHILVVEDHEDGREFLRRLLRADGHSVDAVGSCAEARERLAAEASSAYHLMLTDVGLPDGSGWDLVTFAQERVPALRVGVITGWEPMVSSEEAVRAEFVLRKPLRAAELLAHVAGRKVPALPE
ncbi:MAG: response regulator [Gemmatimonadaceae bacterium]|nr:response regulator [Gemmatimonadaceae bacterium]